jgi:hypothetical protein
MDFKHYLETALNLTLKYIAPLLLTTLVMGLISIATLGILAPVMFAGYAQAALMMIRNGREPKIKDLFSEMGRFLPLLAFGLASFVVIMIGFSFFFLPGILVACGITYISLYLFPLMTDRKYGLMDALKKSYQVVSGDEMRDHLVVAIIFIGISAIGGSLGIGWLFTQPLATVFLMLVYDGSVAHAAEDVAPDPPPPPPSESDGPTETWTIKQK